MCAALVSISITNRTYTRCSSTVSTCRKSQARMPDDWAFRNCRHVGDARRGAGPSPAAARIRRIVPCPTRYPRASSSPWMRRSPPARVLPRQLLYQRPDLGRDRRTSRRVRIGPLLADQAPVPGQQGARGHDPMQPQAAGQQRCQRGEYRPVSPVRSWPGDLPPQHRDLMAKGQDLHILDSVATSHEGQPAEHADYEQVDQSNEHERRA